MLIDPSLTATLSRRDVPAPRAQGMLRVAVERARGGTALAGLRQEGALKALFPRPLATGPLETVFLNTSGGLTGGDRMTIEAEARAGADLVLSSQAAERAYRAQPGPAAQMDVTLRAGTGARIDWLPQETILFEGSHLARRMTVDLAGDARVLIVEPLIFGRAAMGEVVQDARFRDWWRVRRDGKLVLADAVRLEGNLAARMDRTGCGGGARAMAGLLLAGPDAAAMLEPLRAVLPPTGGASLVREGIVFARILAKDGFNLRRSLIPAIEVLTGRPVPKVWRL